MTSLSTNFPPIRACIFGLDGLLINSEDIITLCTNEALDRYGRPGFTRSMRAQLMFEAGRRAGMRVVWVPHPDLVNIQPIQKDVLAGRTGRFGIGDDWDEITSSLENLEDEKYGIQAAS